MCSSRSALLPLFESGEVLLEARPVRHTHNDQSSFSSSSDPAFLPSCSPVAVPSWWTKGRFYPPGTLVENGSESVQSRLGLASRPCMHSLGVPIHVSLEWVHACVRERRGAVSAFAQNEELRSGWVERSSSCRGQQRWHGPRMPGVRSEACEGAVCEGKSSPSVPSLFRPLSLSLLMPRPMIINPREDIRLSLCA